MIRSELTLPIVTRCQWVPSIESTLPRFSLPTSYYCIPPLAVCSPSRAVIVPVLDLVGEYTLFCSISCLTWGLIRESTVIGFAFSVPEHDRELHFRSHFFLCVCVCDFVKSCHSLVCWCFGADADSQPFPPFFSLPVVSACVKREGW